MKPQPKTFTKKTELRSESVKENKKLKLTLKVLKFAVIFAVFSLAVYGGCEFYNTHTFQSPIVFQNPIPLKKISPIVSPTASKSAGLIKQVYAESKPYSIDQDIKDVFGQYSDKAFLLLTCENKAHDPLIKNINTDRYQSIDWGVFQINDHWQGVTNVAFLIDPKINIRMAYNIFSRDGYQFKLWTCGRKLGI